MKNIIKMAAVSVLLVSTLLSGCGADTNVSRVEKPDSDIADTITSRNHSYSLKPLGSVVWSDTRREQEEAEFQEASIITYDQRSSEVANYMDNVNYFLTSNGSLVKNYKVDLTQSTSKPTGFTIPSYDGQVIVIEDETNPEKPVQVVTSNDVNYTIYNLVPDHVYKVNLQNNEGQSTGIIRIKPTGYPRFIYTNKVMNVRDLGGWPTEFGKIRYEMLYRGAGIATDINSKYEEDIAILSNLGIGLQVDLRSMAEAAGEISYAEQKFGKGKSEIPGANYVMRSITGYSDGISFQGKTVDKTIQALHDIIDTVLTNTPVYFNCAAGADRTGTIAFLIEGLLGVSEYDLDRDYELTSFSFSDNFRFRNDEKYVAMKNMIKEMDGDTLQSKIYNWFISAGFDAQQLTQFINYMTIPAQSPV